MRNHKANLSLCGKNRNKKCPCGSNKKNKVCCLSEKQKVFSSNLNKLENLVKLIKYYPLRDRLNFLRLLVLNELIKDGDINSTYTYSPLVAFVFTAIQEEKDFLLESLPPTKGREIVKKVSELSLSDYKDNIYTFLETGFYWQFEKQEPTLKDWGYYDFLYNYKSEKVNIKRDFIEHYGFSFLDFKRVICLLFEKSLSSWEVISRRAFVDMCHIDTGVSRDKINNVLNLITSSQQNFIDKFNVSIFSIEDSKINVIDKLDPFKEFPIIEERGELLMPLPFHILKSVRHKLYYDFLDNSENNSRYRDTLFPKITEDFLKLILKKHNIEAISEFEYGKENLKGPDFTCIIDSHIVFIELKNRRYTADLLKENLNSIQREKSKAMYGGILQCVKKENHYKEGLLSHEDLPKYKDIKEVLFLTLSIDEFYSNYKDTNRGFLDFLKSKDIDLKLNNKHIHLSIDSFIRLLESKINIVSFMKELPSNITPQSCIGNRNAVINYNTYVNTKVT